MFFILELLIIISYLINDFLGFGITSLILIKFGLSKDKNFFEKLIDMLILVLPLHSISFLGNKLYHVLSWTIIFLVLLLFYNIYLIISRKIKVDIKIIVFSVVGLFLLIVCNYRFNFLIATIEIVQIALMVLPIITTFICKEELVRKVNCQQFSEKIINVKNIILATAVATIFQYLLYTLFNVGLGNITIFPNRTIFDLFFKAYSVLSLFLGLGIVVIIFEFMEKFLSKELVFSKIVSLLFQLILIFVAIVINSSRTGLFSFVVMMFIIVFSYWKRISKKNKILFISLIGIMSIFFVGILSYSRKDMHSFFSDNHRSSTYQYAIKLIFNDPVSFLIGNGLDSNNYTEIMPHNFILEALTTSGFIFSFIIFCSLYKLIIFLKNTKFRFLFYHILICSMFITCFQGNPFTTIIIVLSIIEQEIQNERGKQNE